MKAVINFLVLLTVAATTASCSLYRIPGSVRCTISDNTTMTALNPVSIGPPVVNAGNHLFREIPDTTLATGRLAYDVEYLSSGVCEGRGFGTRGNAEACAYIYHRLELAGYAPQIHTFSVNGAIGRNVVVEIRGKDPRAIVVMAHYDGLGRNDSFFYPGADANASGVAALLEIARNISGDGTHTVVLAAIDGHGVSMAGANELHRRYPDPVVAVNLDTMGSTLVPVFKLRPDYMICLGGGRFGPGLFEVDNAGAQLHLSFDYYGSERFTRLFYRDVSDQRPFVEAGIPCVMFTSGITFNTNKATDTCETLDYDIFARRVSLITAWLESMNR